MSVLLDQPPYGPRDERLFIDEMNRLTGIHWAHCVDFRRIWPDWTPAERVSDIPFLHVGLFKRLNLKTDLLGVTNGRTVYSSSTGGVASQIVMDDKSSKLQTISTHKIFADFIGDYRRPLLILDHASSLRSRTGVSARIAAAMSLQPFASETHFLLNTPDDASTLRTDLLASVAGAHDDLLIYGFSWILWQAWGAREVGVQFSDMLAGKRVRFVHSGGWKKLENIAVSRELFDSAILKGLHPSSQVLDYYGLVEQLGVVYPLCEAGFRHAPVWADVISRDIATMEPLVGEVGQLQLLNPLAYGAPYHSVLTEDRGRVMDGDCKCGRLGRHFELLGRVPKVELRGCANV